MHADILALDYEGAHIYGVSDDTAHYELYTSTRSGVRQDPMCQKKKWHTPT